MFMCVCECIFKEDEVFDVNKYVYMTCIYIYIYIYVNIHIFGVS